MTAPIRRRTALGVLAGAASTWSLSAVAQQKPPMPVVGWLSSRSETESVAVLAAFHKGLDEAGFVATQNVAVIYRWAEGRYDQLRALAADLVDRKVHVIFAAGGPPSALATRLGRSLRDLANIGHEIELSGAHLRVVEQSVDTERLLPVAPSSACWRFSLSSKPTCAAIDKPKGSPAPRRPVSIPAANHELIGRV